jgi:hypothetical protein
LHGVQGVVGSNPTVPTKNLQKIQSLSGGWIFLCLKYSVANLKLTVLVANWLPIEIGLAVVWD